MPVKQENQNHHKALRVIRNVYLYLVSMVGLVVFVIGAVGIINNVLQNYVFGVNDYASWVSPYSGAYSPCLQPFPDVNDPNTINKKLITPTKEQSELCVKQEKEQQEQNRRNNIGREFSIALAQMAIGLPLWLFHWGIIQKEYKKQLTWRF